MTRCFRAFTLIELLVVVAIIALLISILLPSLSQAREQAKTVVCVSNLGQVGKAMHQYFHEWKDWFPFEKRNISTSTPVHAFYYGGHPGRPGWWGYDTLTYRDTPAGRPFNRYLYDNLSSMIDTAADQGKPWWEQRREMPVYRCPSDEGGFWNTDTGTETQMNPIYYDLGSSYDSNYHFVWNWASKRAPGTSTYLQKANAFLGKQYANHVSTFIILFEDPFDSAQWNNIPRFGWHKQWNKHSFLFLDGHAQNRVTDTVAGNRGVGWKTAANDWYNDPDDPDYQYRDLAPR